MPVTFFPLSRTFKWPKMWYSFPKIRFDRLINNLFLDLLKLQHRRILQLINLYTTILNSSQLKQSILNHIPIYSRMIKILHFLVYCLHILELLDFLDCYDSFITISQDEEYCFDIILGYSDFIFHVCDYGENSLTEFLVIYMQFCLIIEHIENIGVMELISQ